MAVARPGLPRLLLAAGAAMLPGLLGAVHVAGLLYFLNPALPFAVGDLAATAAGYALPFALGSLVLHVPALVRAPQRLPRLLPWTLTGTLLAAAVLDGYHASRFAFYLPPGINVRLIKAAFWLGLAALVAFYTALLHALHRRRYGPRSRLLLALLVVASSYVIVERREAFRPRPETTPASAVAPPLPLDLLVVGIDSATLDVILPLAEQERLPFLAETLRHGTAARLRTLAPPRPVPLWVTLATGRYPHEHGVVGPTVFSARGPGPAQALRLVPRGLAFASWGVEARRPVGAAERQALALWEVLGRLGVPAGVVGWPTTDPSAPGIVLAAGLAAEVPPAPAAPAAAASLADVGEQVQAAALRDLSLVGEAHRARLEHPELRALFLRLPGLAAASRRSFGGYVGRQLEGRSGSRFVAAEEELAAYYRLLDEQIEALWRQGDPSRTLLAVVSPSGAATRGWLGRLGRAESAVAGVAPAVADGVLVLRGEGILRGAFLGDAAIEDVAPTLLYGLGLPVARDLDGRALTQAFEPATLEERPLAFLPSYETLAF